MMRCTPAAGSCQHYSGILVLTRPTDVPQCVEHLEHLAGVEVHHTDPRTGKIIAVLESASLEGQEHLLWCVRTSPHVLLAELVYYRCDEQPNDADTFFDASEGIGRTGA